ncbi:MAG: T9SS type A sorting domain-containing protein [Ignavibacteriae bacterium]|nr:T9SS type A sorting domain-containing protein [Ignavibacteriota bacterium]
MKKFIVILVAIVSLSSSLYVLKGEAQWVPTNGPNGGWCESMYAYNGYLFACSNSSILYRSTDNGSNWTSIYNLQSSQMLNMTSQGQYLFMATDGKGVLRSSDNGMSWTQVNTGFPYSTYPVENIVTSGQYLVCGEYRMYRSSNFGNSWDSCTNGLATPLYIHGLNAIGNKVYAGTNKGAYVSSNSGANWTSINNGIATQTVEKITSDGTSLYASASNGVYKSTNDGVEWYAINNGLPTDWYYDIIYDGSYLFTTTLFGRYRSSNGGLNWESCINGLTSMASVKFYISGNRVFSVLWGGAGIQYTTNHGNNWEISNNGFHAFTSPSIAVKDNIIYTCGNMQGLAVSSNDGATWQYVTNNLIDRYTNSVATNSSCVFISTVNKGILKSTNNGINWARYNNGIDTTIGKVLYAYDDVIFATDYNLSYRSSNNGENWTSFDAPSPLESMARIGDVFVAGSSGMETGGIIRSTNKGLNWATVYPGYLPIGIISKDSTFYFRNYDGFYKSTNLGVNWVSFTSDYSGGGVKKMYVVDNKFVLVSQSGVYSSSNNGVHWVSRSNGLPTVNEPYSLVLTGTNAFLTISSRGVWKMSKAELMPVVNISTEVQTKYSLSQNYPNPFNPMTNVKFSIVKAEDVKIVVYDVMGREVQTLVNEKLNAGTYETKFDGSMLTSGVYFYRMVTGEFTKTKRMLLIK